MTTNGKGHHRFGALLAGLRQKRAQSQLALALDAGVSPRHLSFLESGRSMPSRPMVLRLAAAVGAPPDVQNSLLLAAGYAPAPGLLSVMRSGGDGLTTPLRHAIEVALSMQSLPLHSAVARARPALADVGLRWFHAGVVTPPASPGSGPPDIRLHAQGFPHVAWLAHNVEFGYRAHDPLVRATLERHHPFFWEDVLGDHSGLTLRERGIFDEAKEFHVHTGFVAPIRRRDGSVAAVSCMGEDIEARNPSTRLAARVICTAMLEKFENAPVLAEYPTLHPEARDLLRWVLDGRDLEWIAENCGLPRQAVSQSAREVCSSLGVTDLLQGALRAQRYHLLGTA